MNAEVTHSAYGMTECTSLTTTTFPFVDSFDDITSTVGRPSWGTEVIVVDDDDVEVPRGTPGELFVRGYNVMQAYWQEPEKTAETITPDGWLRTGDIGVMDDRGFVKITDRKKDVIFVGGFNVYPAEVERILGEHPQVDAIAIVGAPDERLGEVPVAFVQASSGSGLTEAVFLEWASQHISNFKAPRRAIMIDDLPRNASMKVLKKDLRTQLKNN
ncbi:AMP-binding protein [Aeromicrobium sp. UC242_57]|uniref:AMP-binding protein n=1 Tax=Aeromicrobium sp. UC242_57 TaxID=3374624 RepID=UPI0037A5FF4B